MQLQQWSVKGSAGEPMHGTTHTPDGMPCGVVLLGHGFKGYKDYGMFPWIAQRFAELGYISHRFNYSHSGMLAGEGPFERPDLFEQDSWNRQVEDLRILSKALRQEGLPLTVLGHSRGGVAALLAVGRGEVDAEQVITLSAPSTCNPMTEEMQRDLLSDGYLESPSSRTGQMLRVGKRFLQEQLDNPQMHDLISLVKNIESPMLVVHGERDPTVPVAAAHAIAAASQYATLACVPEADHVFNTPNPFSVDGNACAQLAHAWDAISHFVKC